jgi:tetratricopeptide (TPR) repeat protein
LGQAYYYKNDFETAVENFRWVTDDPETPKPERIEALLWLGDSYYMLEDTEQALEQYALVVELQGGAHDARARETLNKIRSLGDKAYLDAIETEDPDEQALFIERSLVFNGYLLREFPVDHGYIFRPHLRLAQTYALQEEKTLAQEHFLSYINNRPDFYAQTDSDAMEARAGLASLKDCSAITNSCLNYAIGNDPLLMKEFACAYNICKDKLLGMMCSPVYEEGMLQGYYTYEDCRPCQETTACSGDKGYVRNWQRTLDPCDLKCS